MICNLCGHEVVYVEPRDIRLIPAWCPNCGAFSDGKGPMKLPSGTANVVKAIQRERDTYRDTCKSAQEAGTRLWNTVVRVKNLLRAAQPFLEHHEFHSQCEGDPFLLALCLEVEEVIGPLAENEEQDGRELAKRLGIDIEKWAEEIRAKVEAATKGTNDGIES